MALHSRRSVLASAAATVAAAGCLGDPEDGRLGETTPDDAPADTTAAATDAASPSPGDTPIGGGEPATVESVDGAWTHPGFDPAGTRFDPGGRVPDTKPRVAWSASYGGERAAVVVADESVFVAGETGLLALDATSGERRWSRSYGPETAVSGPVVGDALYVAVDDEVRALSPADGSPRWTSTAPAAPVRRLVADGGTVAVTTEGTVESRGAVLAIVDGEERWQFRAEDATVSRFGGLAVGDDAVYAVGENSGSATWHHALEPATGEERWRANGLNHSTALTVAGDAVLAGGFYGNTVAQATRSGAERWRVQVGPAIDTVGADGDVAFVGGYDAEGPNLHAVSLADGERRWTDAGGGTILGAGEGLVVAGGGRLRGLDAATGEPHWERRPAWDPTGIALADGVLFVAGDDGTVRALIGVS